MLEPNAAVQAHLLGSKSLLAPPPLLGSRTLLGPPPLLGPKPLLAPAPLQGSKPLLAPPLWAGRMMYWVEDGQRSSVPWRTSTKRALAWHVRRVARCTPRGPCVLWESKQLQAFFSRRLQHELLVNRLLYYTTRSGVIAFSKNHTIVKRVNFLSFCAFVVVTYDQRSCYTNLDRCIGLLRHLVLKRSVPLAGRDWSNMFSPSSPPEAVSVFLTVFYSAVSKGIFAAPPDSA